MRGLVILTAAAIIASGFLVALRDLPTARADQVPGESGLYMHVGDNLFKQPFQNDTGGYRRLMTDGDFSSRFIGAPQQHGAGSIASGGCGSWNLSSPSQGINTTYDLPDATVDFLRWNFMLTGSGISGSQSFCLHAGVSFSDGSTKMLVPIQTMPSGTTSMSREVWANFSANTVTSVWVSTSITSCNCNGATRSVHQFEIEGYLKNSTTSDPILNIANQAASNTECLPTGPAFVNFASDPYTAPLGTFYVMTPAVMPLADTSPPNPMQIYTSFSGVTSQFYGWSRVIPDITGSPDVAVAIWKVTTVQPGIPIFVKPANNATGSASINSTDVVCRFERVGNMYSSTLINGHITAPLNNWGGGTNDVWGVVHMANGFPINSVEDTDLSGTGSLFLQDNMTFGPQMFATGAVGQSTTISLDTLPPFSRSGNAYLVAVGQHEDASGSSANFHLQVNGLPAQAIMNGRSTTNEFEYAIFLVDDVAVRNGLSNDNGTVGQSFHRPFESESYQLTIGSGYDPTQPAYFGNTFGLLGHAGITCLTICSSNMLATTFPLPAEQTNSIRFHTQKLDGTPLQGVRVLLTNTSTAILTDGNGNAEFTNSFVDAHFTLTKQGYVSLCADYKFRNSPGTQSGTGANGCPWLAAYNASYQVTMMTLQEANAGNSGSITIGGSTSSPPTIVFEGNTTRIIPDRIEINITRTHNADLFVGLDKVDPTSGLVQHNVIRAMYWKAFESNTFAFFYPNKARSTSQEIGLHVLWVINDTGVVLNHTKFFLLPAGGSVGDFDVTITSDFVRGIEEKGYISAQQTFQSQYQASILAVQKSVRDQVYEDFQKVSDYGWFVIGFLLFLATVRAFRR